MRAFPPKGENFNNRECNSRETIKFKASAPKGVEPFQGSKYVMFFPPVVPAVIEI